MALRDRKGRTRPAAHPGRVYVTAAATDVEAITLFPPKLDPIQVDDDGPHVLEMGRGALRARIEVGGAPIELIT